MLERVLVALLAGGHVLLEGVPGLAKTLTVKTVADVLGGSFKRLQFTPDLVPADLVGTRIFRPDTGGFDTELGPVFCNFLLADEINRAPAKVQSALLEVMQERQVTIGHETHRVPRRSSCWRRRTRSSPRAPTRCPRRRSTASCSSSSSTTRRPRRGRRRRALAGRRRARARGALARAARRAPARGGAVYVDRRVMEYAVALTTATARARRGELGRVRRLAARLDQPDPRRPRAGAAARPRLHAAGRRARPRARRAAPPHRAHVRGAGGRRGRRPRARRRPASACRCRASSSRRSAAPARDAP